MPGLIVEPSVTYQKLLSSAIESGGIETKHASTGSEALTLLQQQSFDLVVVAMHLQDMDALKFSSHLRTDSRTRQIPVVMVTSNEDKQLLDEAFSAGVTEIFAKHELDKITSYATQFCRKKGYTSMPGHILYIGDSSSMANAASTILKDHGYTVDHCVTGEEGIQAFKNNAYDLLLTDILLKGKLNGYGTVKAIRHINDERKQNIPILVFSVVDDTAHIIELLRHGANDYVSKPLIPEELLARVSNLIACKKLLDKVISQQNLLQEMIVRDSLTGLYNQNFLMEIAPSKLCEASRHNISCSLISLRVDQFSAIHENFGSLRADQLLKTIASLLINSVRQEDIAIRHEEEFVLLLWHCSISNALITAERIRQSIETSHWVDSSITVSAGVTEISQYSTEHFSQLFNIVRDTARQAQSNGGNQVVVRY